MSQAGATIPPSETHTNQAPVPGAPEGSMPTPTVEGSSSKRKRALDSTAYDAEKHRRVMERIATLEATLDAAESIPPTLKAPVATAPQHSGTNARAIDVHFHFAPADSNTPIPPDQIETTIQQDEERQRQIPIEKSKRLVSKWAWCIPCMARGESHFYLNSAGGLTGTLRGHLIEQHPAIYYAKCLEAGLNDRILESGISAEVQPDFSRAGLTERLVKWLAVDDQAPHVIECPEFRELILYCGQNKIKESDIPHRHKLAKAAWAMYLLEKEVIDAEMKCALGHISLTSDLWTDPNSRSFMAVTAHYIGNDGKLKDRLIAFRKIDGHHTGTTLGHEMMDVLVESGIADNIGCITLDNASNNNSMMEQLVEAFKARGWTFDAKENRIHCFPHVMNLAVQAVTKAFKDSAKSYRDSAEGPIDEKTEAYLQALESDPIEACRKSIAACCSSGLRKEGLRKVIVNGNALGRFRLPNGQPYTIPEVELLRDTPTRQAVVEYAFRNRDAQIPVLSHHQYEVLQDIVSVLSVPHSAQELLSAEKTPTLSLAFPVYEGVIQAWEQLVKKIPELGYAMVHGIGKIRNYINRTQQARVHTLSMIVNPALKFEWFAENWKSPWDRQNVYEIVKNEMLALQSKEYEQALSEYCTTANTALRA
ncbi:Putative AC transposase [Rhizoctonia solani]|uniref:Putative AC transposase n=1 Tax=Rhizoctonia solani TaxID=456999 RepID=A0A0K6GIN5_9AGAM|nr:Putative AC transposase [Rhizoctonia solani]